MAAAVELTKDDLVLIRQVLRHEAGKYADVVSRARVQDASERAITDETMERLSSYAHKCQLLAMKVEGL